MEHVGNQVNRQRNFKVMRPRFTIVYHPVRERFKLNFNDYAVIDSIHQLSHHPDHPWCTRSKKQLADFLGISDRHVFRAINTGIEKGVLEKNDRGDLRSTALWVETVVLYQNASKS